MTTKRVDRCRSCRAPIRWHRTEAKGNLIPLDYDPTADGNVVLIGPGELARVMGPLEAYGTATDVARYTPHHATCPDAADWRTR